MREVHTSLLVIGAGPAGIAAAVTAAGHGIDVCIIDMQSVPGGQIWRGQWQEPVDAQARHWMQRLRDSPVHCEFGVRLVATPEMGVALASSRNGPLRVRYKQVLVATGARELLLPFPGWTLPGVCGAGGLQVMVKDGLPIDGKRVVVAGTGPLLLAVAASLRSRGAKVACIAEQASWRARMGALPALLGSPQRLRQALDYVWALRGIASPCNAWPLRAEGDERLHSVIVNIAGRSRRIECDYLAAGFGLIPNLDVAAAFGCEIAQGTVTVSADQQTSVAGIYCAGEGTGIGGVEQALAQGTIAGDAVAGHAPEPGSGRRLAAIQRTAQRLLRHTQLRPELRELATPETLLCRCENVSVAALRDCHSAREARLYARLGMGHCQGRICSAAAEFLYRWPSVPPRPPLAPMPISHLDLSTIQLTQEGTSK